MKDEVAVGERPNRVLLRRRHVLEWTGISPHEFKELCSAGVLRPLPLKVGGKPYYRRKDVEQVFFQ